MQNDVYEKLAKFLDNLPAGFPRSETGVELRILRHLFTPEEASMAMHLELISEEARVIAVRAGLPLPDVERILAEMARKRLIYAYKQPGKPASYMATQFVVGFWEGQVNRLDRELVEMFEEYLPVYASADLWSKTPQLRTIPAKNSLPEKTSISVQENINPKSLVLPYECIDDIIAGHSTFAVANCVCRQEMRLIDHDCGKPLETCMAFDSTADFFVRDGRGRYINREEALAIIRKAEETGLVLQPGNDQTPGNLCMCCGCCCGALRIIKLHPHPARAAASPFIAALDRDACAGCGTCLERCQMDALSLPDGMAELDLNRCIGCGLCVTTCPSSALTLVRKAPDEQPAIPKNVVQMTIRLAQSRGRLGPLQLARMAARSAADRIRSVLKQ
jgi:ferredoxin